jgi:hypothetical protein
MSSRTTVDVNDALIINLDYHLTYAKAYLESAETHIKDLFEPEEYNTLFKERITEAKEAVEKMEQDLEGLKNTFKYYKTYTDIYGDEGTWVV